METNNKLHISVSPHFKSPRTTQSIMLDVLIALAPAAIAGCFIFGWGAMLVIAATVAAAVLSEFVYCKITKKPNTAGDLSAAVTGLLLALNLPANIPVWQAVIGAVFAVVCVKCLFGGIGRNFANPAITARIFMLIAFVEVGKSAAYPVWETVGGATPLVLLSEGKKLNLLSLFIGDKGGAIGEVCILALLVGGIYLLARKVISWHAPVCYIATVFLMSLIREGFSLTGALAWVLSGGVVLAAFFMATDYSTTPTTGLGKAVFGIGAGLLTVLIRFFGAYPEGASFAILIMNILTPYIDKFTARRPFGAGGVAK